LKASCASTLARKYKANSLAKMFKRFGKNLKDSETGISLRLPNSLRVTHTFNVNNNLNDPGGLK
jgi:Type II intron maturase